MLHEINNILPARNGNWVRVSCGSRVLLRGHSIGWGYMVPVFPVVAFFRVYSTLRVRLWCFHIHNNDANSTFENCIVDLRGINKCYYK